MVTYFNMKTAYGVETVDELDSNDFDSLKDFRKERDSMLYNYNLGGMPVYISRRCTNDWKNR